MSCPHMSPVSSTPPNPVQERHFDAGELSAWHDEGGTQTIGPSYASNSGSNGQTPTEEANLLDNLSPREVQERIDANTEIASKYEVSRNNLDEIVVEGDDKEVAWEGSAIISPDGKIIGTNSTTPDHENELINQFNAEYGAGIILSANTTFTGEVDYPNNTSNGTTVVTNVIAGDSPTDDAHKFENTYIGETSVDQNGNEIFNGTRTIEISSIDSDGNSIDSNENSSAPTTDVFSGILINNEMYDGIHFTGDNQITYSGGEVTEVNGMSVEVLNAAALEAPPPVAALEAPLVAAEASTLLEPTPAAEDVPGTLVDSAPAAEDVPGTLVDNDMHMTDEVLHGSP